MNDLIKSKFIDKIYFLEIDTNYNVNTFCKPKELKNLKSLFLTKSATENDWKSLTAEESMDLQDCIEGLEYWKSKFDILGNPSNIIKHEGLDINKNYLIIKEDE